jgi:hypothetical protein
VLRRAVNHFVTLQAPNHLQTLSHSKIGSLGRLGRNPQSTGREVRQENGSDREGF